jgi:hypothetical protein
MRLPMFSTLAHPHRPPDVAKNHSAGACPDNRRCLPVSQAGLGHEKITTTIDTYAHLLPHVQVAAADAAQRALGGTKAADLRAHVLDCLGGITQCRIECFGEVVPEVLYVFAADA